MVGCQPYAPAAFTPRKYSWYSFLLEAASTPGPQCDQKDFTSMKNPLTPAGIKPATFRFVAQHLNHCATTVHRMMVGCQLYAPAAFTPTKYSWYSFLLEAASTPGPQCDRKDFTSIKNPLTPAGIEQATFRFVAQCLNHCATAVPSQQCGNIKSCSPFK